jgi:hypothetical protein
MPQELRKQPATILGSLGTPTTAGNERQRGLSILHPFLRTNKLAALTGNMVRMAAGHDVCPIQVRSKPTR